MVPEVPFEFPLIVGFHEAKKLALELGILLVLEVHIGEVRVMNPGGAGHVAWSRGIQIGLVEDGRLPMAGLGPLRVGAPREEHQPDESRNQRRSAQMKPVCIHATKILAVQARQSDQFGKKPLSIRDSC